MKLGLLGPQEPLSFYNCGQSVGTVYPSIYGVFYRDAIPSFPLIFQNNVMQNKKNCINSVYGCSQWP